MRVLGGLVIGAVLSGAMITGALAAEAGPTTGIDGTTDAPLAAQTGVLNGVGDATAPGQQGTATPTETASPTATSSPTETSTPSGGVNAGFGGAADSSGGLSFAMFALGALVTAGGATAFLMSRRTAR
ncbi:MAG: hypothetical protein R3C39_15080 [Dehalococcoidia bacterium]